MNNNVTNSIVDMENEELRNLVNQVKETVATGIDTEDNATSKNTFASASLWNIHKTKRSANSRRATLWN